MQLFQLTHIPEFPHTGSGKFISSYEGCPIPIDSFIIDDTPIMPNLSPLTCSAALIIHAVMAKDPSPMTEREIQIAEDLYISSNCKDESALKEVKYAMDIGFSYCIGLSASLIINRLYGRHVRPMQKIEDSYERRGCYRSMICEVFSQMMYDERFPMSTMDTNEMFLMLAFMHNQFHRGPKITIPSVII